MKIELLVDDYESYHPLIRRRMSKILVTCDTYILNKSAIDCLRKGAATRYIHFADRNAKLGELPTLVAGATDTMYGRKKCLRLSRLGSLVVRDEARCGSLLQPVTSLSRPVDGAPQAKKNKGQGYPARVANHKHTCSYLIIGQPFTSPEARKALRACPEGKLYGGDPGKSHELGLP
ncbi:hypothetical protein CROQUDRAFT_104799 [Cronartium quercuum f. sp. fusiforme G11]|uniref:Uncharacterized protein n=1 Tax=Cronartium quercuum f. sp. fusiforme G11 TaxID=708437 RepID=A0A9P6NUS2_9BASI|nr:hypothetical protein CROQUDRAFT_104799 [Cronartium quercuum f. sp. fusiforme G11]